MIVIEGTDLPIATHMTTLPDYEHAHEHHLSHG